MTTANSSQQEPRDPLSHVAGEASVRGNQAFERLAEPMRREIRVHCYRMLGSLHEAEDLVQETYLRAWRSFDSFESGSFRAWLYKIATNACLNALESRKHARRLLPDQQGPAITTAQMPDAPPADVTWLEPFPDSNLDSIADDAPNPEARYSSREAVQLAFVAAIQEVPPRQRAVILLCDVLGWAASEAATLLGGSIVSVNSALQRGRETLAKRYPDGRPPAQWYVGRQAIGDFFALAWQTCGGLRLVPTSANGQPAFAVYEESGVDGNWAAHSIQVLTLGRDSIPALTIFLEPRLFKAFGLPSVLPAPA